MSGINPQPDSGAGDTLDKNAPAVNEKSQVYPNNDDNKTDTKNDITKLQAHDVTGLAVVEQGHTIPTTGERKVTTGLEYWAYCLYGKLTLRLLPQHKP